MRFHICIKTYYCITHHLVKNLTLFKVQDLTLCTCAVGIRHGHPRNVEVITSNFTFPGYHSADSSTNDSHLEYYKSSDKGSVLKDHCQSPIANYTQADISTLVGKHWYHGDISRNVAEKRLKAEDTDCFLVRKSQSQKGKFVLSVYFDEAMDHFMIHTENECYEVDGSQKSFDSLQKLVEFYQYNCLKANGMMLVIPCPCPWRHFQLKSDQGMSKHIPLLPHIYRSFTLF